MWNLTFQMRFIAHCGKTLFFGLRSGVSVWNVSTSSSVRARPTLPSKRTRGTATCADRRGRSACWSVALTGRAVCSSSLQIITTKILWVLRWIPLSVSLRSSVSHLRSLHPFSGSTKGLPPGHGGEEEAYSCPVAIWRHSNRLDRKPHSLNSGSVYTM